MKNSNKMMTSAAAVFLAAAVLLESAAGLPLYPASVSEEYGDSDSAPEGVPDVIRSYCDGTTCRLTVVANCGRIEDGERFAGQVVQMYRDNAFHTVRFSTDTGKIPEILEITVYFYREDVDKGSPVMEIRYYPQDPDAKIYHRFL